MPYSQNKIKTLNHGINAGDSTSNSSYFFFYQMIKLMNSYLSGVNNRQLSFSSKRKVVCFLNNATINIMVDIFYSDNFDLHISKNTFTLHKLHCAKMENVAFQLCFKTISNNFCKVNFLTIFKLEDSSHKIITNQISYSY